MSQDTAKYDSECSIRNQEELLLYPFSIKTQIKINNNQFIMLTLNFVTKLVYPFKVARYF